MINNRPLLAFEQVDFLIATNLLQPFDAVKQGIPTKVVAAFFQRDPQCLLAHPDSGYKTWDDLKQAPLYMGNTGRLSFFRWLNAAHGFSRAKLRPYNHSLTPFLVDKTAVMQGYATAEPKRVEEATRPRAGGVPAGRPRLVELLDAAGNARRADREEPRAGAAIRRRLDPRLVSLPVRRRRVGGERPHQARQSRDDRRRDRLLAREDARVGPGRLRRRLEARHRRHASSSAFATSTSRWSPPACTTPAISTPPTPFRVEFVNKGVGEELSTRESEMSHGSLTSTRRRSTSIPPIRFKAN